MSDLRNPANGIHGINQIIYKIPEVFLLSGYFQPTICLSFTITAIA
ncbi:MAG: hypothetical protein V7L05_18785 [Nostoc sp.]